MNNLKQGVPFFAVSDMERSLRFYVDALAFEIKLRWIDGGKLRWCWLERGGAAVMLQEFPTEGHDSWRPSCKVGEGVTICFICEDAIQFYREVSARGVEVSRPAVGNSMWVTRTEDPDGYKLLFESATDAPEDTEYSEHASK